MSENKLTKKDPFIHISKRNDIKLWQNILFKVLSVVIGLFAGLLVLYFVTGADPFTLFNELFKGAFSTERRTWTLFRDTMLLLGVGLALIPAFRMKYWNLGANGAITISALVTAMMMAILGSKGIKDNTIILIMVPLGILAGIIWSIIPAIFKTLFKTNESLFTLMMNYIAEGLVALFLAIYVKTGSGALGIVKTGNLPDINNNRYLLTIIVIAVIFVLVSIYLTYTKHGYEITVVGESENTAKYIGINSKKVIIRTLIISGAICGIIGVLIAGSINHSISEGCANNMGFTAIMTSWLAKFNPIVMIFTSFFVAFITRGMSQVQTTYKITNSSILDIVIGVIYFIIIGSEFFIRYKVKFNIKKKNNNKRSETIDTTTTNNNSNEEVKE